MSDVHVTSEIARLELIVISPPGGEFDLMVPENLDPYRPAADGGYEHNPDYLLFDDLVLLSALRSEHQALVDVISAVTGAEGHLTWFQLLVETLGQDVARSAAIGAAMDNERRCYGADPTGLRGARAAMERLDAPRLARALITGRDPLDGAHLLRWPAPNHLFARDLAAVTRDAITLTYAARPARGREMALSRVIMRHHRRFADVPKIDIGEGVDDDGRHALNLEGGDIQVIGEHVALIGVGIRTTLQAVERLAPKLFDHGFEVVLAYHIPQRRAAMHIDTLFTRIDESHCLIYPPLAGDASALGARLHRFTRNNAAVDVGCDLLAELAQHGIVLEPVRCGGADPIMQAREQWSDGANAFALAPGVIIGYGRNERTFRELNTLGYEVVTPEDFVRNALYYVHHEQKKVAVALGGHELVRGRGGPRCLTMPLRRASQGA